MSRQITRFFVLPSLLLVALILGGAVLRSDTLSGLDAKSLIAVRGLGPSPLAPESAGPPSQPARAEGAEWVGDVWLPGGIHGDVWVHRNAAYVGTWRDPCSGAGVKVVDVTDPSQPHHVASLAGYAGTSAEDVVVIPASTRSFRGDLLAVGLQVCARGGVPGVEFWDVSTPAQPRRLSFFATPGSVGVHELHLFQRGDRVLALLAVPYAEYSTGEGDIRILDVTDPRRPYQLADWGAFRDLGVSTREARGGFRAVYGHSANVSADGNTAYISYWDAGLIQLDITDPEQPRFISRITYAGWEQGDTHSAAASADGRLLAVTDEYFNYPWGLLRLYDNRDPARPIPLAQFGTPHALGESDALGPRRGGWYTAHNAIVRGNRIYTSWFNDGLRVIDISDPAAPWEVASFVPDGGKIWGVALQGDLAYLSDMNYGLYVVRIPEPAPLPRLSPIAPAEIPAD